MNNLDLNDKLGDKQNTYKILDKIYKLPSFSCSFFKMFNIFPNYQIKIK